MKTNFESAVEFSNFGWNQKNNGKRKVASGPGSSNESSVFTKKLILETIKDYNIKSILDLGCGDWTWMSKIRNKFKDVSYEGWDASPAMVNTLIKKYGNENTKFFIKDIVTSRYPKVDLIICRDVLFHLDESLTIKIIKKIKTPYLISTSHLDVKRNTNIKKI